MKIVIINKNVHYIFKHKRGNAIQSYLTKLGTNYLFYFVYKYFNFLDMYS